MDKGGANKKGIKLCQRQTSTAATLWRGQKIQTHLQSSSQALPPAWNSKMTSVRPRALLSSSIFGPTATHSIKRGQQILEIFFPARSKKSIQVSGDFPVWSDSDSWSPSGVRWPSSVSLPRPQTIDYTDYGLVSLAQQCFISYARSNIIKVWARTGNQLRRKWMEKLHLCIGMSLIRLATRGHSPTL